MKTNENKTIKRALAVGSIAAVLSFSAFVLVQEKPTQQYIKTFNQTKTEEQEDQTEKTIDEINQLSYATGAACGEYDALSNKEPNLDNNQIMKNYGKIINLPIYEEGYKYGYNQILESKEIGLQINENELKNNITTLETIWDGLDEVYIANIAKQTKTYQKTK